MFQDYKDENSVNEVSPRLSQFRALLKTQGLDGYILQRTDEYMNEYVAPYAERLAWLTGFTGSTAQAAILKNKAALFVDGRYTIQAKKQLDESLFETVPIAEKKLSDWLCDTLRRNTTIGFDPKLHTTSSIKSLEGKLSAKNIKLVSVDQNLIDQIWQDQPPHAKGQVSVHPMKYAGENPAKKIKNIQTILKTDQQHAAIITKPDSIAWLLNIRGQDVPHTPLPLSYLIVHSDKKPIIYIDQDKLGTAATKHLLKYVNIEESEALAKHLSDFTDQNTVRLDTRTSAYWFYNILHKNNVNISDKQDPCILPKAIKNETEIEGSRNAHKRDAIAMCRFLCWLDENSLTGKLDEITASQQLEKFRHETNALKDISFDTISGAGSNGAIIHYRVTNSTNQKLKKGSLYLVDSGGQYLDGTTDITRTVAIGKPTQEMRSRFTQVLKGMIALSCARFPEGTTGAALDSLARQALWQAGVDYAHGTGHGVGSYLSVHEGPQSLAKKNYIELQQGMILSNEPGYYKEGKFGIRIENLILVSPPAAIRGGEIDMFSFETLTFVPIDIRLIDTKILTPDEISWINKYHSTVRKMISPHLDKREKEWLKQATIALSMPA